MKQFLLDGQPVPFEDGQSILEAARTLFLSQGYNGSNLRDIAREVPGLAPEAGRDARADAPSSALGELSRWISP